MEYQPEQRGEPWDIASPDSLRLLFKKADTLIRLPNIAEHPSVELVGAEWDVCLPSGSRISYEPQGRSTQDRTLYGSLWLLRQDTVKYVDDLHRCIASDRMVFESFGREDQQTADAIASLNALQSMLEIDPELLPIVRISGTYLTSTTAFVQQHKAVAYEPKGRSKNRFAQANINAQELYLREQEVNHWLQHMQMFEDKLNS